jgi:hypothetical protein
MSSVNHVERQFWQWRSSAPRFKSNHVRSGPVPVANAIARSESYQAIPFVATATKIATATADRSETLMLSATSRTTLLAARSKNSHIPMPNTARRIKGQVF